ncbi:N-acetyltransferase [Streptococcus chenjunshii]|uniref:N-acetyltransferase n=1 Tax=Streptococcus chenjunshii TaxID=2173853 RepID=A0A372KKB6_9STRE|nr:N-acetyltransferase [Streptococcus chenjunshii]RFU50614.1 N-acetyltransferase [Streptococcus chenjunshii]RFU52751.1 N-acetyltransferase [Streptococcus chenjunshii]
MAINEFGQEIGEQLNNVQKGILPQVTALEGQTVKVVKLEQEHIEGLYDVYGPSSPLENWTYLPIEPFTDFTAYQQFMEDNVKSQDPYYLVILDNKTGEALGTFSLMRIDLQNRVAEMGWVVYSERLKRTRMATEAQFLVMEYVFEDMHCRRYEWKCDHLNQPSRQAALRLGFKYEGTFRQAAIYKGRNRDTDWFSMLDQEWPENKKRFTKWLSDDNFTASGEQKVALQKINV